MSYKPVKKAALVKNVFNTVAKKYDIMNDIMSFGMHRLWKKKLLEKLILPNIQELKIPKSIKLLDVAGGTGDIAFAFIRKCMGEYDNATLNVNYSAIICDINEEMLTVGKNNAINRNEYDLPVEWIQGDVQKLPFADNTFDYCTISFGIRNVDNIPLALQEIRRVLKKDGIFVCMEFANSDDWEGVTTAFNRVNNRIIPNIVNGAIKNIYDFYSTNIIPAIGNIVVGDKAPYEYLVNSIKKFPKTDDFIKMVKVAGFENISCNMLCYGGVILVSG